MLGERVSHYEILKKLGEGGMGVVYQARDTRLGRLAALKALPHDLLDSPEQIQRLEREARAISALNHPNIATLYGIEEEDGRKFLALEYLPGGTLYEKLAGLKQAQLRPSLEQAVDWAIQIAEGLAHAHQHGIVHRDVKSSNVLFADESRVKITDFGLAKLADADGYMAADDVSTLGTPPCMSPEQALNSEVDHRSDIFSFGIVLFEMLTGEMPFRGPNAAAVLHDIAYTPAPPLNQFRAGIPDALQRIVSKTLEKDRERRYQSVTQVLADLRRFRSEMEQGTPGAAHWRRRAWTAGLILPIAIALAMTAAVPGLRDRAASWIHGNSIPAEKRIAVLLFTNVGGNPQNQALADGLIEVVSNSLTRLQQFQGSLLVVPASDVRKESVTSARDAWRLLGANLAITGSVQRIGNQVQVMINLVDTRTVSQLRTAVIRSELPDLTALQDGVLSRVVQMLEIALQPKAKQALEAGNTPVAGAYRYYVEGLGYLRRYDRPENIDRAIGAFKEAAARDPNYVLAYAGVAEAYWRKYSLVKDPEAMEEAFANCSRAIALNDELAPVHVTMGQVEAGKGQYELAEREFGRSLELDPLNADAYRELATAYEAMGRLAKAEATYKKAIQLRPSDWAGYKQLGVFYFRHGRYGDAEQYFRKVIELTPDSAKAYSNLGGLYLRMGRNADAEVQLEKSVAIEPTATGYSNLGSAFYLDGRYTDAAAFYEKATLLNPTNSTLWGMLADAYRWTPELAPKAPETYRRAIGLAQEEVAVNPRDAQLRSRLAAYLAVLGDRQAASTEIARALKLSPTDGYVQFWAALVYEQTGQRDRALEALKSALHANYSLEEIRKAPPLKDLRADSRFARLLGRAHLDSDITHHVDKEKKKRQ